MKDLLTYIFYVLAENERARIDETDANSDKWYELVVTHDDGSMVSVESGDTFAQVIKNMEQYVCKYRFDRVNIGIWENKKMPNNIYHFFSTSLIYSIIHDYFRHQNELEKMRFVGEITFSEDKPQPKKAYYNYGEPADIFIDEIAFRYFRHLICYIPDNGEKNNPEDGWTYNDFIEITEGNTDIARHLFDEVTWEYPSTLYEQWASSGTLDELEEIYEEKTTVYSYTDIGDFVHCNYCDKVMLLPTGADKCPSCYAEGVLAWHDEENQEMTHSKLEKSGNYRIETKNEPEISEYLSDEVLRDEFGIIPNFKHKNSINNSWEIVDANGTIFFGSEDEMKKKFLQIARKEVKLDWEWKLKLIEIHGINDIENDSLT